MDSLNHCSAVVVSSIPSTISFETWRRIWNSWTYRNPQKRNKIHCPVGHEQVIADEVTDPGDSRLVHWKPPDKFIELWEKTCVTDRKLGYQGGELVPQKNLRHICLCQQLESRIKGFQLGCDSQRKNSSGQRAEKANPQAEKFLTTRRINHG